MKNDVVRRGPTTAEPTARRRGILRAAFPALAFAALLAGCAASGSPEGVRIDDGWVRPVPLMSGLSEGETADVNSAAYMVLRNPGREADRLIGATTSAARAVELH